MCPPHLLRGVNSVIVRTVYHELNAGNSKMLNYLIVCESSRQIFFGCGIIILGDFNHLNVNGLITNFKLKQIINLGNGGQNTH